MSAIGEQIPGSRPPRVGDAGRRMAGSISWLLVEPSDAELHVRSVVRKPTTHRVEARLDRAVRAGVANHACHLPHFGLRKDS